MKEILNENKKRDPSGLEDQSSLTPLADNSQLHPREIAEDTLQHLLSFSDALTRLSLHTATKASNREFYFEFSKLIDGISTFIEGVATVKTVLRIESTSLPQLDRLENELLQVLQSLLDCQEKRAPDLMVPILEEGLPRNLDQWKQDGIPAMIRRGDC